MRNKGLYIFAFSLLVSVLMSSIMSFVLTLVNVGWKPIFYRAFLKSFGISTAVSFLLTFFVIPVIQRALDRLFVIGEQNGSDF